jgi:hypothetical protein
MENNELKIDRSLIPILRQTSFWTMIFCIVGFTITAILTLQIIILNYYYKEVYDTVKSNQLDHSYYKLFFAKSYNFIYAIGTFIFTIFILQYHFSLKKLIKSKLQDDLIFSFHFIKFLIMMAAFIMVAIMYSHVSLGFGK